MINRILWNSSCRFVSKLQINCRKVGASEKIHKLHCFSQVNTINLRLIKQSLYHFFTRFCFCMSFCYTLSLHQWSVYLHRVEQFPLRVWGNYRGSAWLKETQGLCRVIVVLSTLIWYAVETLWTHSGYWIFSQTPKPCLWISCLVLISLNIMFLKHNISQQHRHNKGMPS